MQYQPHGNFRLLEEQTERLVCKQRAVGAQGYAAAPRKRAPGAAACLWRPTASRQTTKKSLVSLAGCAGAAASAYRSAALVLQPQRWSLSGRDRRAPQSDRSYSAVYSHPPIRPPYRYCGAASRAPGCACRPPKPPEQSSASGAEGGIVSHGRNAAAHNAK